VQLLKQGAIVYRLEQHEHPLNGVGLIININLLFFNLSIHMCSRLKDKLSVSWMLFVPVVEISDQNFILSDFHEPISFTLVPLPE